MPYENTEKPSPSAENVTSNTAESQSHASETFIASGNTAGEDVTYDDGFNRTIADYYMQEALGEGSTTSGKSTRKKKKMGVKKSLGGGRREARSPILVIERKTQVSSKATEQLIRNGMAVTRNKMKKSIPTELLAEDVGAPASLYVVNSKGTKRSILEFAGTFSSAPDAAISQLPQTPFWDRFQSFLLLGLSCSDAEKYQLMQTFGESLLYVAGRSPVMAQVLLGLPNSTGLPLAAILRENYERYFRASKLLKAGDQAVMTWGSNAMIGYPLSFTTMESAGNDMKLVRASMQFLVTDYVTTVAMQAPLEGTSSAVGRLVQKRDELEVDLPDVSVRLRGQVGLGPVNLDLDTGNIDFDL